MHPHRRPSWAIFRSLTATLVVAATLVALPVATSAAVVPCDEPPPFIPQNRLAVGMIGKAWTAVEGRTPVSFNVEILGILEDGIAPGIDFILIETSGDVIDDTGGIASGMSGSPVYVNGKLAGAISYGFFAADQRFGGMTPAEPMMDLFSRALPGASDRRIARSVALPRSLRTAAAAASGSPTTEFGQAELLPTPLAVSGAREGDLGAIARRFRREGTRVIPYASSSTRVPSGQTVTPEPVEAGEPFAAALSYGLVTYAGIGTATAVCGDLVVAFGHPFRFVGSGMSAGFSGADIAAVIPDPSNLYGPFKLGNVREIHGVVDQDRISGIRGIEGKQIRHTTTISTDITNLDDGKRHQEQTVVVLKSWTRFIAWDHIWYAMLGALQGRSGTMETDWTMTGTIDGEPFSISRENIFSGSISDPGYEVYSVLRAFRYQDVAQVRVSDIDFHATVTEELMTADVGESLTASSLAPALQDRERLPVTAGDTVQVRMPVDPRGPAEPFDVDFTIDVPAGAEDDGQLRIETGQQFIRYNVDSIDQLLRRIERLPRNDTIRASLRMEGERAVLVAVSLDYVPRRSFDRVRLRLQG